ncbi:sugar phosphate isomerase/epimerase [Nordella sp. HKS 07]|uniref:sugar phosphate isomerase/epimerase family protein n=1 Tax=Nordella sp. HKS 07 TaxID=2712222 RepID=UPI0013E157B0|nr:sugar phosphate isomerase/epimerase [Nordella sp. HKS 07]QIG51085.1 sugar phosphate isomerase/epimerase [Nordella sp. HKS 07]
MKIGFNLLLWTGHVGDEHRSLLRDIKKAGYDGVEVPVFQGDPVYYARLGQMLDEIGLERTVVTIMPSLDKDPLSGDAQIRKAAFDHAKWFIDCSAALGAPTIGGPIHSVHGHFTGKGPTADERKRALAFHRKAGDYAAKKNIRLAVEALNRFECYFLTTMQGLADYLDEVDHPAVSGMYDTFHANIEEADPIKAIRTIRRHMSHVHISENDRGTPGKGHIDWTSTYKALKAAKYDGWLTIEAFGRSLPALAAATRVWRDFFPNPESVYRDGIRNIRKGWAGA